MSAAAEKNRPAIRAARIDLCAADGAALCSAGIIVGGDDFPEVVMWGGDPFVLDERIAPHTYRKVKPYRLDTGE
jgi:hypothetical protein